MIYLDHHAATPLSEAARAAMRDAEDAWANASSAHAAGRRARSVLERARAQVAATLGAQPADLVFTAGGTEACNLMIAGAPQDTPDGSGRIVTTALEHPAVLEACEAAAEQRGVACVVVPDWDLERFELRPGDLVAIQWVNHEVGVVAPLAEIGARAVAVGATMVVDATQALGRLPIRLEDLPAVAALALASHKIGGPSGAGALWVRRDWPLQPQLVGGGQERGRRPGTQHAPTLAGFGAACAEVCERLAEMPLVAARRDRLEHALREAGARINGVEYPRVATVVNASVPGWRGEELVAALDLEGVCGSAGAACSSGVAGASPTVAALYPDEPWRARATLRLSLGPEVTDADVTAAIAVLKTVLARVDPPSA